MPSQSTGAGSSSTSKHATAPKKKPGSSSSIFSLKCGCKDAKSVSVASSLSDGSDSKVTAAADPTPAAKYYSGCHRPPDPALSARPETSSADTITFTTATTSTSRDDDEDDDDDDSPSFSGLLRQLNELERSVAAWDLRRGSSSRWPPAGRRGGTEEEEEEEGGRGKARRRSGGFDGGKGSSLQRRPRHRRTQSDGGGGGRVDLMEKVVKQTEDPPGDFRRSMLQMIVEKEILGGEELRQLLYCFIALNSPSHHALIVRAFSDIWRDVISGYGRNIPRAADLLVPAPVLRHGLPPPRRPATGRAGRSRSPTRSAWGCEGVPEPLLQRLLQLLGRPPRREHPSHLAGRPRSDRGPGLVRLLRHGGKPCQVPGDRAEPGVLRLPVLPHAEQVRRPRL